MSSVPRITCRPWLALALGVCVAAPAHAAAVLFHAEGDAGARKVFFANTSSFADRTPMDAILGDVSVVEIEVIGVNEAASEPDWTAVKLQFECPVPPPPQMGRRAKASPPPPAARRVRVAERGYGMSRAARELSVPATGWGPVTLPVMQRAGMLACNEVRVKQAEATASQGPTFDNRAFNTAIAPLGLGTVTWVMETTNVLKLRDLAWMGVWKTPRPKGPGDRVLSDAELARSRAALEQVGKEMQRLDAEAQAFAQPRLQQMRTEDAFRTRAAAIRGKGPVNELEQAMLNAWVFVPEARVTERIRGTPRVSEAGGLRYFTYSDAADTRSATVEVGSGRVVQQNGAFTACDVTFVTMPDDAGAWRVADVRVEADGPAGGMCRDLLNTPVD